jgi:hypothetical protein
LSQTLAKKLQDAEAKLAALPAPPVIVKVDEVLARLPQAVEKYRRMVQRLGDSPIKVERGRELLRGAARRHSDRAERRPFGRSDGAGGHPAHPCF